MELTVLGSGITVSLPGDKTFRYPSAHLLKTDKSLVLVDAGVGVLPQLAKLGLRITDINTICITHFHADHFNLEPLLQSCYRLGADGLKAKITICGPAGIKKHTIDGYRLHGWTYDKDLLTVADFKFVEYRDGQAIDLDDGLKLIPYKTTHFELDAYALRFERQGQVFAYSGDSTKTDGLTRSAAKADLFACEAANNVGQPLNVGHVGPLGAGQVAKEADSKHLVLVHYSGLDSDKAMLDEVKASGFKGQASVAKDLDSYNI